MARAKYVVEGACVKCTQGSAKTELIAKSNSRIGNKLRIVEADTSPASFAGNFGDCKRLNAICAMAHIPKWFNTNADFVSGNELPCVTMDSFLICTAGAGAITPVDSGQSIDSLEYYASFIKNLMDQFGFNERAAELIVTVKIQIDKLYPDVTQRERDYMFTRVISGFSYSYKDTPFYNHAWAVGAGYIWDYSGDKDGAQAKKYFIEVLGFNESDYSYLRYNIRLQNQMAGGGTNFDPNQLFRMEEKGFFNKRMEYTSKYNNYKSSMESILGRTLTDEEFQQQYRNYYNSYTDKGDFEHMMYTISGNIVDTSQQGVEESFDPVFQDKYWVDHNTRREYIGWLGDAINTANGNPSMGDDDYISDLDAANIVKRMDDGSSFMDVFDAYYGEYNIDNSIRESEFIQIYSYDYVEKKVLDAAGVKSVDKLKNKWPDSYHFLERIKPQE